MLNIGVVALQGAFVEHEQKIREIDGGLGKYCVFQIRAPSDIDKADGIILPGGESTAMRIISQGSSGGMLYLCYVSVSLTGSVFEKLKEFARQGKPIWGTCAGCILLSDHVSSVLGGGTNDKKTHLESVIAAELYGDHHIGGIGINTCRNFFGRQTKSFETSCIAHTGTPEEFKDFPCVFIRAPAIVSVGPKATALAAIQHGGEHIIVAARQNNLLATCFHPELTPDSRIHKYFLEMVVGTKQK